MPMSFPSALIRYGRMARNWSQEGLCEGICAVSYLSKIEQGKASPSGEILGLLLNRLGLAWHDGEEAVWARELADAMMEAIFSMDGEKAKRLLERLDGMRETFLNGPAMLDLMLLERLCAMEWDKDRPIDETVPLKVFEACFTPRQRALWLLVRGRAEDAAALLPVSFVYLHIGSADYLHGRYTSAAESLLRACSLAAEEGRARVMLHSRLLLGNCYSDLGDDIAMLRHYQAARRLARDLRDTQLTESISYNIAATDMELGRYDRACAALASRKDPNGMTLHKLAICYEKLGRREEALAALDRAQTAPVSYPGREWCEKMCGLVRYRLTHPGYLKDETYGAMLCGAFEAMKRELPAGFVGFHEPWMREWYVANRQYKQAYELARAYAEGARRNGGE